MTDPRDLQTERRRRFQGDLELARAVGRGDPGSLQRFERRLELVPRILAVVNARLGRRLAREDLADLVQDTLIVIWRKLETFEGRATLETWMHRIAFLELMNRVRALERHSRARVASLETTDEPAGPSQTSPGAYERLEEALRELGPPEAEIVRLKHYESLTFSQIGRELGTSPSTVKTRYYRGLAWLRRYLVRARGVRV